MYYAAMRPAEAIHLRNEQCHLPETGWGMLNLSGGVVAAARGVDGRRTDDGAVREVHSLKRRAATATRPVPSPCRWYVSSACTSHGSVGRRTAACSGTRSATTWMRRRTATTWARTRKYVLTRTELTSGLAKRPYDLRHAGISFWLYSGVDPAECARRAGPEH